MSQNDIENNIGKQFLQQLREVQAFIKTTDLDNTPQSTSHKPELTNAERTKLIRIANQLFNTDQIEKAKQIFIHVHYIDGIIRVGDYYHKKQNFIKALQMYKIAQNKERIDEIIEKMVKVIQKWVLP